MPNLVGIWNPELPADDIRRAVDAQVRRVRTGLVEYSEYRLSEDGFLYSRCAVVANGRGLYEAVLADPTRMPKDIEFEALLSVAQDAYRRATGGDGDIDEPSVSVETFDSAADAAPLTAPCDSVRRSGVGAAAFLSSTCACTLPAAWRDGVAALISGTPAAKRSR